MTSRSALVIGGSGQVGRHLTAELMRLGWDVDAPHHADADLSRPEELGSRIRERCPAVVINVAAVTDVDGCTREPTQAWRVNAMGPIALAQVCRETRSRLVHFSTDSVFDGEQSTPYREDDSTNPLQVYGRTKRAAEEGILDCLPSALILRVAWVFGGRGPKDLISRMLAWARQANETGSGMVRAATDQRSSPTHAGDLARATASLLERRAEGLLHVVNAGSASRWEFATQLYEAAEMPVTVLPVSAAEFPVLAARPHTTALAIDRLTAAGVFMRTWQEALLEEVRGLRGAPES